MSTLRAGLPVRFRAVGRDAPLGPLLLGLVLGLVVVDSVAKGKPSRAAGVALLLPLAALIWRRAENGLLVGITLLLLVPSWLTLGLRQAPVYRIAAALALVALVVALLREQALRPRRSVVDLAVLGVLLVVLASWLRTTPHSGQSAQLAANAVVPLAFFFVARRMDPRVRWTVALVILVAATLGACEVLYEGLVSHRPLFVNPDSYIWNQRDQYVFRPGGLYESPPAAGAILAMTTLLGLPLLSRSAGLRRLAVAAALSLQTVAVVVTFTRAAIIGLGLGAVFHLIVLRPASLRRGAFVAAGVALAAFIFLLPKIENSSWFQRGVLRQGTLAARQSYWQISWPLITNTGTHLLLGHGVNSLIVGRPGIDGPVDDEIVATDTLLQHGPHNQYVRTLLELGLLGLAATALWLLGTLAVVLRAARRVAGAARPLLAGCGAAVACLVVVGFADDSLRSPPGMALAALASGFAVTIAQRDGHDGQEVEA